MSVDPFLGRRWQRGRYDCLDFAREVWLAETGEDLKARLDGLFGHEDRTPSLHHLRAFERLVEPVSPCLVLMRRPRVTPHLGVFLRGRVVHLREGGGAEFQFIDVATRGFTRVEFFR